MQLVKNRHSKRCSPPPQSATPYRQSHNFTQKQILNFYQTNPMIFKPNSDPQHPKRPSIRILTPAHPPNQSHRHSKTTHVKSQLLQSLNTCTCSKTIRLNITNLTKNLPGILPSHNTPLIFQNYIPKNAFHFSPKNHLLYKQLEIVLRVRLRQILQKRPRPTLNHEEQSGAKLCKTALDYFK